METQLTLRIGRDLASRLDSRSRMAGVKRSAIVRAALEAYLGGTGTGPGRRSVRERMAPYIGILRDLPPHSDRDEIARTLRAHNWRE